MKAIVQRGYGHPLEVLALEEVPDPVPGPGEVLVAVRGASINTPDWITVTGVPAAVARPQAGWRTPRQPIRGTDLAGEVRALGAGVTGFAVGDAVMGSAWKGSLRKGSGTFAELAVAPADQLVHKPEGLSFPEAAAAVMSGNTARTAMVDVADVQPGMTVLVNGASGGVGTFAVQVAAALGAHVTGVCSTRNVELVRGLGATDVVDHTTTDVTTTGRRFDVVLDNVMNHPVRRMAQLVADGGVLVPNSVGQTDWALGRLLAGLPRILGSMAVGGTPLRHLVGMGGIRVATATERSTSDNLRAVLELIADHDMTVVLDRTVPLADTPEAVAHMLGHRARGNIAIEV